MTTQLRSARFRAIGGMSKVMDGAPSATRLGRLIQVALAFYLIPVLLIVLVVGGVGMVILAIARVFTRVVYGPDSWPRTLVGPRTLSSDPGCDNSRR